MQEKYMPGTQLNVLVKSTGEKLTILVKEIDEAFLPARYYDGKPPVKGPGISVEITAVDSSGWIEEDEPNEDYPPLTVGLNPELVAFQDKLYLNFGYWGFQDWSEIVEIS